MRTVAIVALMGCLLSWTAAASAQDRIAWVTDWRQARDIAQQQHRLVLLHFYSDTCAPCQKLERDVFPRAAVARAISTGYVAVKINVDRFPQLRDHYKIEAWPTDVIVTAEGREIARSVPSPADSNRYIAMLDSARSQYGIGRHLTEQVAGRAPVGQPSNRYGTGGFGGAAANNATSNDYGDSHGSNFQPQQTAPPQQPTYVTNQYSDGFAQQAPAPANVSPRYGDAYPGPSVGAPGLCCPPSPNGQVLPGAPDVAPGQGISQMNPYAQRPPIGSQDGYIVPPNDNRVASNPSQLQGNQLQAQPTRQQDVATPPAPSGSQFAMDGFCPVTLVDQGKWQKGDTRWGAVHQGKTYLFASQQGQQQFLASPDRFAPILSGYDLVRYAEAGQLVEGRREHGVYFGNRIFLFADEVALDRFSKHTDFYMARVRQASVKPPHQPAIR
ncbi:MAG: thioredoxin family protein [Pirellulaceae bacterium]|nr:thioredoxin family protein [Pirellulaceae bacterium]HJN12676.1 thioredoxin family protein [Pirellulaceae bacterium]